MQQKCQKIIYFYVMNFETENGIKKNVWDSMKLKKKERENCNGVFIFLFFPAFSESEIHCCDIQMNLI